MGWKRRAEFRLGKNVPSRKRENPEGGENQQLTNKMLTLNECVNVSYHGLGSNEPATGKKREPAGGDNVGRGAHWLKHQNGDLH